MRFALEVVKEVQKIIAQYAKSPFLLGYSSKLLGQDLSLNIKYYLPEE